jgi:predicted metal-dependent hydrolase
VDVFAPEVADEEEIHTAVMKKAAWIARKLDALERYHPLPVPKKYISGETLVYLGRQYRLKVEQGSRQPAKLAGRFLSTFFYALLTRCQPDWRKRKEILDNISKID